MTLFGWLGDHPPTDEQGFLQFASSLTVPDIYNVIKRAEPLGHIAIHKLPTNLRRHYERMKRFPEGYLILWDAMCSFNPIYGQAMSVAAMQAEVLDHCLEDAIRRGTLQGIASPYFASAAAVIKNPWMLALVEDFRFGCHSHRASQPGGRPHLLPGYANATPINPLVPSGCFATANLEKG